MKITDTTPPNQNEFISFVFELSHAPEKVWRALTNPVLLGEWLLPVEDLKLEKGAAFKLRAPPQPGWNGVVDAQFLEIEPHQRLQYSWKVGDIETVVTFKLIPTPQGTRVEMVQTGFKEHQKQNWGGARYGWKLMAGKLVAVLDTSS